MKKLQSLIKNLFPKRQSKSPVLEKLKSKKEEMKAELESLSEFENFLKELTKQQ